jgi:hypothetical protein
VKPLEVWRKDGNRLVRGKLPIDSDEVRKETPNVPFQCIYGTELPECENSERYWAAFGYEYKAPIVDLDTPV